MFEWILVRPEKRILRALTAILAAVSAALVVPVAHADVPSVNMVGDWSYSASSGGCPGVQATGSISFTYQYGSYGWLVTGQTIDGTCQTVAYQCHGVEYAASNPITPSQFLGLISSNCWLPGGGAWTSVSFDSAGHVAATGHDQYGNAVLVSFARASSGSATLDLVGTWNVSVSLGFCPGVELNGVASVSYQNGAYAWTIDGQTVTGMSCQVVSFHCADSGYVAANPISATQFLGAMNTNCWALPISGAWSTVSFDSATQATVSGSAMGIQVTTTIAKQITPTDGLWAIDAENNGQSGRGFQIETHNGTLVFTYYGYRTGGHDHWYLAAGALANSSFNGNMTQYQGGTALGAAYTPAVANGSAGPVTLTFTSATTGSITLPGESAKDVSKFAFSGGGSPGVVPSNGLWVINAENNGQSGRGFQIEQNGGVLVFTYYGYDSSGQETWYLASGFMSGSAFTGTLTEYGGGTVLGSTYAPAAPTGSAGSVSITFATPTSGTINLPGESAKEISKFSW